MLVFNEHHFKIYDMPNNNLELRSEHVQEILTRVPNWMIRWGNTLVFCLLLMVCSISWFVKYPDVIKTEAMVTTTVSPQKEYAKISGSIDTLFVKDNQYVKKGTPLAVIENSAATKDVYFLKSIIDTLHLTNQDFTFPIDIIPILSLGNITSDYVVFENEYLQYQLHKKLLPFSSEELANNVSKTQLQARLRALKSQKKNNKSELILLRNDLDRHQKLFKKGVISAQEYEAKQVTYTQAERSFTNMDISISQLQEAISNADKISYNTDINKTKDDINLLKNVKQSFNQLKRAIKDWEMQYVLTAKIEGTVSFLHIWNKNQTVLQGDLVFTVIPTEHTSYIARLKSPSLNSGKIQVGQKVAIQLENFPNKEYGALQGTIHSISLIPDEEGLYLVNVDLPEKLITTYKKEIPFKHEMLGQAKIITEDLRLLERFFYQLKSAVSS